MAYREHNFSLRLTPQEFASYERLASESGVSVSEWIRSTCNLEVKLKDEIRRTTMSIKSLLPTLFVTLIVLAGVRPAPAFAINHHLNIDAPLITTMFFDQGTVYSPSIIVEFGPAGLPSKMRFTLQHPTTGSLQDIYCVRPYLWVCTGVSSTSSIGTSISVSGVINPANLEWDAESISFP